MKAFFNTSKNEKQDIREFQAKGNKKSFIFPSR
jgi:hypothetical protein